MHEKTILINGLALGSGLRVTFLDKKKTPSFAVFDTKCFGGIAIYDTVKNFWTCFKKYEAGRKTAMMGEKR